MSRHNKQSITIGKTTYSDLLRQQGAARVNKPKKQNKQRRDNSVIRTSVPVAQSSKIRGTTPKMRMRGDETVITHRELIGTVVNPESGFNVVKRLRFNPASETTFPWLSAVAPSWEFFKWEKLRFICIPRCATTQSGTTYLSPDYDAADGAAVSEFEIGANKDTVESACWQDVSLNVSRERMYALYKRHCTASDVRFNGSSQDQKTLDPGFLSVCTEGDGIQIHGKLYVEYTVVLSTPQFVTSQPSGGSFVVKEEGLNGTGLVFNSGTIASAVQEKEPIVTVLPNTAANFPGRDFLKFEKDWSGFIEHYLEGTGITLGGSVTKNGTAVTNTPVDGLIQSGIKYSNQWWGDFKEGDRLGLAGQNATTLTKNIFTLGGASYLSGLL